MYLRAILSFVLVFACAFTLAGAQEAAKPAAPDTQIMDWVFAMPQGWCVANSRLGQYELVLEQPDRANVALTQVTFGRPGIIDGSFRTWFDAQWEQVKKDYKSPDLGTPTESDGAAGHKMVAGAGSIKMADGKQRVVMLVGVNKGKRAGTMCFITEDLEQLEANAGRMDGLLASVHFASQRPTAGIAPVLRTKIDPQVTPSFLRNDWKGWPAGNFPLEGLWGAETEATELVTHGGRQYRTTYFYRMFFKDGTVLNRMPAEGLLSFDPAWLQSEFADYIGTYTVAGNVVTVTTGAPGKTQLREELTLKDGVLHLGDKPYRRIPDDRPALDGAYIKLDYQRHAPELRKRIVFSPKGSFVDEGFNSILGVNWWCGDNYRLWEHPAEPGTGTWRIEKNTLELIYADGRKHRYAFHLHTDAANKDVSYLVLNGRFMMRQGEPDAATPEPKPEPAPEAAPALPTQDTQIMDWVFAMPEGWRVANSRLTLLTTKELALEQTARASEVLTQLTFGRPVDIEGGFRKWYDVHFENLKKDYPTGEFDAPAESDGPDGYKHIAGVGLIKFDNGRQRLVMLVGVNKGKRAGVMCFITEDMEHVQANAQRLDAMLATVRFASQRAPGEKAPDIRRRVNPDVTPSYLWPEWKGWPKGDAPLEGLWGRQGLAATSIGIGYEMRVRTTYYYLLFFKDGTVFTRMPPEGLLSFDLDFLRNDNDLKRYLGTYTVDGDTVTVKTGGGESEVTTTQYTRKGDDLQTGEAVFKPIADEKPVLDGGYIKLEYGTHFKEFHKGIRFAADGRFADEGFCAMLFLRWWQADNYYLLEQTAEPGTGRWRIEKNTLVLTYDDGRRRRYGFHVHRDKDGTTYLVLNSMFMKQHPINAELPPKDGAAQPRPEPQPETPAPVQPADAADTQVYDWLFKMPEGWRAANSRLTRDTTNLLALEQTARADRSLTQVTFGRPGDTEDGLAKWFDGQWLALKKEYKFEQAQDPEETDGADGYKLRTAGGSLTMPDGKMRVVMLFGLGKGKRVGSICFISEDIEELQANVARLEKMLGSLSFAGLRAKDAPPLKLRLHINPDTTPSFLHGQTQWPKGEFPLEGIWGLKLNDVMDTVTPWGWTFRTAYAYVLLFKDGTAIRHMPPEGLLSFDPAWWKGQFPEKYGTYAVNGDVVTITTNEGKDKMTLTLKDGDLWGKAVAYKRLAEEKPKLDGKYMSLDRQGSSSDFLKTMTFKPDGTFEDGGFNALLGIRWPYGDTYWQMDQPAQEGKGTWRVEKHTLELVYEDGRKRRFGFHTHTEPNGELFLVLNSRFMTAWK